MRLAPAIVAMLLVGSLMGCDQANEGGTRTPASTPAPSSVPSSPTSGRGLTISGNEFSSLEPVKPKALVHVHNADRVSHNVVSEDGAFRTPDLLPGEDATFVAPRLPGEYRFTCTLQPGMHGVLTVVDEPSKGSVPPSTRTPDSPVPGSGGASSSPGEPPPSGY
jgi:hypothetical protein